jgi:hypothetical protein
LVKIAPICLAVSSRNCHAVRAADHGGLAVDQEARVIRSFRAALTMWG